MTFAQFIAQIIIELGGLVGISVAIIKFFGESIADRLSKKYENNLQKDLELYRIGIENKYYVSKDKFDMTIAVYRELYEKINYCFDKVKSLTPNDEIVNEGIEIDDVETSINSLKELINKNSLIFTNQLCKELDELLKAFNYQTETYNNLFNDTEYIEISFISQEDLEEKKEHVTTIIRQLYDNLEILPSDN